MREIGGFMGFEHYSGNEYHENCLSLNSGRNCLRYLIRARHIKKIALPRFNCSAVLDVCKEERVDVVFYTVDLEFKPVIPANLSSNTFLYVINFYGQIEVSFLTELVQKYPKVILDFAQSFFVKPMKGVDTLYTCRKFFGVADGAYLYTNSTIQKDLMVDKSYERMEFLGGRYERSAREFYLGYQANEEFIANLEMSYMSRLTKNILRSINYEQVNQIRTVNYQLLRSELDRMNLLNVITPHGPYAYPLLVKNGGELRKRLLDRRIFVPILWPNVLETENENSIEYYLAMNILPLPCDQRYSAEVMKYMIEEIYYMMEEC